MIEYFRDGGFSMWALLITALFTGGLALARPKARSSILAKGSVVVLAAGLLGIATGLEAVSSYVATNPDGDKAMIIGVGIGELANNGTFAAALFAVLAVASLLTAVRPAAAS